VLTPNQTEAELLTGRSIASCADALQAAEQLLDAGPHTVVGGQRVAHAACSGTPEAAAQQ
jgi:pyridoxal/pyridoxine/pyridoxamine kinase